MEYNLKQPQTIHTTQPNHFAYFAMLVCLVVAILILLCIFVKIYWDDNSQDFQEVLPKIYWKRSGTNEFIVTIGETNLNDPLKDNASAVAENPDHQGEQIFKAGIETAVHQEASSLLSDDEWTDIDE
ncbi:hypothetical protein Fcan01_27472 [Folsomia candida]|uniref:Uncharacterized protein n=1 Tax=Folsomia candida TaxID=158441 RepID=A0A226CYR3_FOLCA|nr:hypothetical protein Fcan01_27472 [Folsomia candida]